MKDKKFENSHTLLKNFLTLAQWCGTFPLYNVRSLSPNALKFKWISWRVFYVFLMGLTSTFCAILALRKALVDDTVISRLTLFFLSVSSTTAIFTQIASKWPTFIKELCKIEEDFFKKYKSPINLKLRLRAAGLLLFITALCEHTLSTFNFLYSFKCKTNIYGWERYFKNEFHYIFAIFPYNFTYGVPILIFTWICCIIWNLGDTFIILLSLIISTRFRQISDTVKIYSEEMKYSNYKISTQSKFKINSLWLERTFFGQVREDYNKIANICKYWNDIFSNLVIMSYAYNLSFILIQLFNSLRQMDTVIEKTYFFYSFGFVIMRTIAVSISAASVNQESKRFLPILNSITSDFYSLEIHRLITQIHVDSSALTGHNFFRITRGMVLNVAAAITTYELVLIQFNQATLEKYMTPNINICE